MIDSLAIGKARYRQLQMESSLEFPALQKGRRRTSDRTRKEHRPRGLAHQRLGNSGTIKGYDNCSWYRFPNYCGMHTESGLASRARKGLLKRDLREEGRDWKDLLCSSEMSVEDDSEDTHFPERNINCSSHSVCHDDPQMDNSTVQAQQQSVSDAAEPEDGCVIAEEYVMVECFKEPAGTAASLDDDDQDWELC